MSSGFLLMGSGTPVDVEEESHGHSPSETVDKTQRKSASMTKTCEIGDLLEEHDDGAKDLDEHLPDLIIELRDALKGDKKPKTTSCIRTDDEFLAKFLRVRNYNVARAREAVCNYYVTINQFHDVLQEVRPSELKPLFNTKFGLILKDRCKLGSKVIFYQIRHWNVKEFNLQQLTQLAMFCTETIIQDKETQLKGATAVLDLQGLSLSHLKQITLKEIKRGIYSFQGGFPIKLVAIHFINFPSIMSTVFHIARMFVKEKLWKRIHFHPNLESLHEHLHVDTLPECLGGPLTEEESLDMELLANLFQNDNQYKDFFAPKLMNEDNNE